MLSDNCSESNDTAYVNVTVRDPLQIIMPADTLICRGQSFTFDLHGTGGYAPEYDFNLDHGHGNGAVHTVSPAHTTTYHAVYPITARLILTPGISHCM